MQIMSVISITAVGVLVCILNGITLRMGLSAGLRILALPPLLSILWIVFLTMMVIMNLGT